MWFEPGCSFDALPPSPRRKLVVEADLEFETHVGAALHRICFVEACATYEQVHECWGDYCKWGTPKTAGRGTAGAKFLVVNLRVASLSKCLLFRRTIYYSEKRETSSTDVGGHYCPFSRTTSLGSKTGASPAGHCFISGNQNFILDDDWRRCREATVSFYFRRSIFRVGLVACAKEQRHKVTQSPPEYISKSSPVVNKEVEGRPAGA